MTVSAPGDIYEQEANEVADTVTRAISSQAQRQEEEEELLQAKPASEIHRQREEEEEELQMQPVEEEEELQARLQRQEEEEELMMKTDEGGAAQLAEALEVRIEAARAGGEPLPEAVRASFEPHFERDFSNVRVHTDAEADTLSRQLEAEAFTTARDIFFRKDAYQPESEQGKKLIAHELTHVVQQGASVQKASPLIQRWGPSDHKRITKERVSESLRAHPLARLEGLPSLEIDEKKLDLLASSATQMDLKAPELAFNIGGKVIGLLSSKRKGVTRLQQYYSENVERALNHGEGGLYSMDSASAAAENIKNQDIYLKDAENTFNRSLTSGRGFDTNSTDAVIGALGDAFHVAQDRGSHGEGAEGEGHAGEILTGKNPDKRATNPDGWSDAEANTSAIAEKASGMLAECLRKTRVKAPNVGSSVQGRRGTL
ncbi:MAG: DUF4157 domain-containing protein [Dehalococcoidia bacterium]|nr:DUF4157 domain-containing protein [Dehalococcoidia bacterium]